MAAATYKLIALTVHRCFCITSVIQPSNSLRYYHFSPPPRMGAEPRTCGSLETAWSPARRQSRFSADAEEPEPALCAGNGIIFMLIITSLVGLSINYSNFHSFQGMKTGGIFSMKMFSFTIFYLNVVKTCSAGIDHCTLRKSQLNN